MDKLEYIPRDLVSVYVGIKKYIVEVIGTENENEALLYQIKFPNGEIQYADKDNIVPIPLTHEILEKNGWRTQNRWYYYLDVAEGFISYIGIDFKHKSNKGHLYVEVNGNNMVEYNTATNSSIFSLVLVLITKWRCRLCYML